MNKIIKFFKKNKNILTILTFLFFTSIFLLVYMTVPLVSSGDDHYFHFKFASRFFENGFFNSFKDFKSIYFTNIAHGEHLLYYNFLFYIVLIPFTFVTPLYLGIKLYAVFIVALIGTILYLIFKNLNIRYAFLWSVGFFSIIGVTSFWRLFLSRPFVFSPFIILLLILALHKRKYFWIFILSFIPLFWHTATFFIPILVSILYIFCYYFYYRKFLWKELSFSILGFLSAITLALVIDSGFFISIRDNLINVLSGVLDSSKDAVKISEGIEVYPKNLFDLIQNNILLCLLYLFSFVVYIVPFFKDIKRVILFDDQIKLQKIITFLFFILSIVFLVAIPNISNRFTDFFIFFSWIFIVLVIRGLFNLLEFKDSNIRSVVNIALVVCLFYFTINNLLQLRDVFALEGNKPETFQEIGGYLNDNLKPNDIIYNVSWDFFPQLYYYAPDQNYVIGLEPKLTYLYNPELYFIWQNISKGYICNTEKCPEIEKNDIKNLKNKAGYLPWVKVKGEEIANTIINKFESHYIVTSNNYQMLNLVLQNSKRFKRVVNTDNQYFLYQILENESKYEK